MDTVTSLERTSDLLSLDASNMLQSIRDFPDQLASGWSSMRQLTIPTHYVQASHVVILAAGTSALAAQYAARLASADSSVPVSVWSASRLPAFVNGRTLVIAMSYSGKAGEISEGFREAAERGAKLFGISTGGEIGALCRKYRAPWYQIQYGAQSRAAFGYLLAPLVETLQRLSFIRKDTIQFEQSVDALRSYVERLETPVPVNQNPAKQLAKQLSEKQLYCIASNLCFPIAQRWTAQLAQNAKQGAWCEPVDIVEHATIERLTSFTGPNATTFVVNFRSNYDSDADALSLNAVEQLLAIAKTPYQELLLDGNGTMFQDFLIFTALGDYLSFYLALIKGVDPTPTPLRDELVARMSGTRIYQR
ncbi:MAG: SIS domain-containing protein [Patescibacteria group bacterium]